MNSNAHGRRFCPRGPAASKVRVGIAPARRSASGEASNAQCPPYGSSLAPAFSQNQIAPWIDLRAPSGRDHGGGVELLDDGGAVDRRADVQPIALVQHGLARARAVEMDG